MMFSQLVQLVVVATRCWMWNRGPRLICSHLNSILHCFFSWLIFVSVIENNNYLLCSYSETFLFQSIIAVDYNTDSLTDNKHLEICINFFTVSLIIVHLIKHKVLWSYMLIKLIVPLVINGRIATSQFFSE